MHERNHGINESFDENNIRHPRLDDISALLHLETECWPEPLRASPETILHRVEHFPERHLVYELNGRVVGVVYSQRIQSTEPLKTTNFRNVSSLHTTDGSITQLLALNVLPELKHLMLGDLLLTCMLRRCLLEKDVKKVVAVTLCQNYGKHTHLSINEYIHTRNAHGQLLDPILRFHECHGATIKHLIPGYRPEDADNLGNGVLVEYDFGNDKAIAPQPGRLDETVRDDDLASAIKKYVVSVTHDYDEQGYSPKRALMDMGLSSLDLYGLRMLIGRKLGVDLDPSFFFRYGTPESIVAYFDANTKGRIDANERQKPADFSHHTTPLPTDNRTPDTSSYTEDSIAIIGMSCRLPGSVNSVDAFWRLLRDGKDAIIEIPRSRWDAGLYYSSDKDAPGKIVTRFGGFLDEVDRFDASFFNIAPREAVNTDPQQRILLELTWEALEHAGLNPESLAGTQTGVFAGIFSNDYELLHVKCHDPQSLNAYFATGNSTSLAAGRISYVFGFQGPAIAVNTACSSSLVAVHLACQSLRSGECGLAVASGINLLLSPEMSIAFSRSGMLAPDGRCKTFDAGANGYVRSEGGGVVVLKRLSQAIADNNTILAVVRGTAINHDGSSNGLTAPNGLAQEAVIRKALSDADVAPDAISYVEAHGTGTSLGDPVELQALESVYAHGRDKDNPLVLGSVKTNIGHTEAAAGIAGLIKVVLSMQHGYIPSHLHFKKLNPLISLDKMNGMIPTEGMAWARPGGNGKYMAGVSSFGFSGTNAHVIVEEAPVISRNRRAEGDKERPLHILTLSAKDSPALQTLAERYDAHLEANKDADLADICYTANTGRSHFARRLAFIGESPSQIREGLKTFLAGQQNNEVISGAVREGKVRKAAFLFTGQGAQYRSMGKHLCETQPVFRDLLCR
ncbi:MAG TPA: beta-ketoacyl synthase N-terminal-like domain-containing protein, partial [Candidatus Brocadiaceae bacterium]|nr:beta-ketoacyl synthase N-terminal-like domain-containing protein [Candidatus Brocadiaceae bacterium]